MNKSGMAPIASFVLLAGCSSGADTEGNSSMGNAATPRAPEQVQQRSQKLLEEIRVAIDESKPGLSWEIDPAEDIRSRCRVGDEESNDGAYFAASPRTTRYVPTQEEWEQWVGVVVEIEGAYGYEPHDELQLDGEDRNVRLTTSEGDWLQAVKYDTGGFSFRLKTICAPIAE